MMTADTYVLIGYFMGYILILLTPGQNMILVSGLTALYGARALRPIILGAVSGVALLTASLYCLTSILPDNIFMIGLSHLISALLIAFSAWRAVRLSPPHHPLHRETFNSQTLFKSVLLTALFNPTTALYIFSHFTGLIGSKPLPMIAFIIIASAGLSGLNTALIGFLMSQASLRHFINRHFKYWKMIIALCFTFLSLMHVKSTISILVEHF